MEIQFKRCSGKAIALMRVTQGLAGYDLFSPVSKVVKSGLYDLTETDLMIAVPKNHHGDVFGRSGLALNCSITDHYGITDSVY